MLYVSLFFDFVLIGLLAAGISYAVKLTKQLAEMRASRAEMERFVLDFNATVTRAEAGIRGLKNASREAGDDLEKLIERGHNLRDELHFLIESADQIASRLSEKASTATRAGTETRESPAASSSSAPASASPSLKATKAAIDPLAASAAERELLRVLKKIG